MAAPLQPSSARRLWLPRLVLALALGAGPAAEATTLTFQLGTTFSGQVPEGTPPFLTATFDDSFGGPNTVRLTMSASGLFDAESVGLWWFNFNPSLNAALLSFSVVGVPGATPNAILTGNDAYMADGDGKFDILFDFPPPPGNSTARFTAGETVVYDLSYISPIGASDFNYSSVESAGNGTFLSAAQIQRIGPKNNLSGHIGAVVPEPTTALLFGAGLAGLAAVGRRKGR